MLAIMGFGLFGDSRPQFSEQFCLTWACHDLLTLYTTFMWFKVIFLSFLSHCLQFPYFLCWKTWMASIWIKFAKFHTIFFKCGYCSHRRRTFSKKGAGGRKVLFGVDSYLASPYGSCKFSQRWWGVMAPRLFPLHTPMRQMKGSLLLKPSEMNSGRKIGLENALFKQN